jgi:hypothetical protein
MKPKKLHHWLLIPGVYLVLNMRQKRSANVWFWLVGPPVRLLYRNGF